MIIYIKGVQTVNKGAELMLVACLDKLREIVPGAKIALPSKRFSNYESRLKYQAYQSLDLAIRWFNLNFLTYFIPKKIRKLLMEMFGIVTEADVDVVLDASGFSYGDQWPSWHTSRLSSELKRFSRTNRKYIFMPQAVGPFTRARERKRVIKSWCLATHIYVRDKQSFQNLKEVVPNSKNVSCSPDFTNLVDVGGDNIPISDRKNYALVIPNNKMISEKNINAETWKNNYFKLIKIFFDIAENKGLIPVFLNHEGVKDQKLIDQFLSVYKKKYKVLSETDVFAIKSIIGNSSILLCSRFHGCVSALSQGVPCMATSWSHKYQELFSDYGVTDLIIKNPEKGISDMKNLFSQALKMQTKLIERSKLEKEKTKKMWEEIESLIQNLN